MNHSPTARLGVLLTGLGVVILIATGVDVLPVPGAALFVGVILLAAGLRCLGVL